MLCVVILIKSIFCFVHRLYSIAGNGGAFWGIHMEPPISSIRHGLMAHHISFSQKGNTMDTTTNNSLANSPNRLAAVVFGAVFLLIGIIGFFLTVNVAFVSQEGELLLGVFEVNPLHNIIHIVIGAVLLIAGLKSIRYAKTANAVVGGIYLLVGIIGLFIMDSTMNLLALNTADNVLHLLSAVILLGVGLGLERNVPTTRTPVGNLT